MPSNEPNPVLGYHTALFVITVCKSEPKSLHIEAHTVPGNLCRPLWMELFLRQHQNKWEARDVTFHFKYRLHTLITPLMQTPRMKSPANYRNLTLFLSFLGVRKCVIRVILWCQAAMSEPAVSEWKIFMRPTCWDWSLAIISHMLGCQRHHRALLSVYWGVLMVFPPAIIHLAVMVIHH